jgi:hypothetical protein
MGGVMASMYLTYYIVRPYIKNYPILKPKLLIHNKKSPFLPKNISLGMPSNGVCGSALTIGGRE